MPTKSAKEKKKAPVKKVVKASAPKEAPTEHQYAHITHETPHEEPTPLRSAEQNFEGQVLDTQTLETVIESTIPEIIQMKDSEEDTSLSKSAGEMTTIQESESVSMEESHAPRRKAWIIILVLILLIMAGVAGVMKYQSWKAAKNPSYAAEVKAKDLISKVAKLTELPVGENPTIAVVSDVSKLPKAPLFTDAQNGDEVLVYTNAHKAYVYRPSANKIIAIGPITIASNQTQSASPSQTAASPVSVVIYNGTATGGLAKKAQTLIITKDPTASVSAVGDAAENTYTTTTVVDVTGKQSAAAKTIAALVGGTVGSLPKAETAPKNTDILIILGKDYTAK